MRPRIYKRVCLSVHWSVGRSVRPAVRLAFFLNRGNWQFWQTWHIWHLQIWQIWQISLQFYLSPLLQTYLCSIELVLLPLVSLSDLREEHCYFVIMGSCSMWCHHQNLPETSLIITGKQNSCRIMGIFRCVHASLHFFFLYKDQQKKF